MLCLEVTGWNNHISQPCYLSDSSLVNGLDFAQLSDLKWSTSTGEEAHKAVWRWEALSDVHFKLDLAVSI